MTGSSNEERLSWFITSTCQLIPKSVPLLSDCIDNQMRVTSSDPMKFFIECGSQAEFYIRPLNTCISDTDTLICRTSELAFVSKFPELPSEISGLSDKIKCFTIEPYNEHPGFVRLLFIGEMDYNWKYKR